MATIAVGTVILALYSISCSNAGHRLSWDEFTEGLVGRGSNCGGNSAAKNVCYLVSIEARILADEMDNKFDFYRLNEEQVKSLSDAALTRHWTPNAKYLLRKGPVSLGTNTHEVVVVCDTAYGNVPQPSIWNLHRRTLRHAVCYSDGTSGWLTPSQYKDLNQAQFFELPETQPKGGTNLFE